MLGAILRRNLYRTENLEDNIAFICEELSADGGLFSPYGGVTKDAALKKLALIINDVQQCLQIDENTDLQTVVVDNPDSLFGMCLEIMKQKRDFSFNRFKRNFLPANRMNADTQVLVKTSMIGEEAVSSDSDDDNHFQVNISLSPRRKFVLEALAAKNIITIQHLLSAVPFSPQTQEAFRERTKFYLDRPVSGLLGLFEEVMSSKHYHRAGEKDLGITSSDVSDLIEFLRPYYLQYEELK